MSRLTEYLEATFETPEERIARLRHEAESAGGGGSPPATSSPPNDQIPPATVDLPFLPPQTLSDQDRLAGAYEAVGAVPPGAQKEEIPLPELSSGGAGSRLRGLIVDYRDAGLMDDAQFQEQMLALGEQYPDLGITENEVNLLLGLIQHGEATRAEGEIPELSLGTILGAFENRTLDEAGLSKRLTDLGYPPEDVSLLIENSQQKRDPLISKTSTSFTRADAPPGLGMISPEKGERALYADPFGRNLSPEEGVAPRGSSPGEGGGGGAGGDSAQARSSARVVGSATGGGQTRPDARRVLGDFRTAFSRNLKAQATGLSAPARKWAMENMDFFLDDYLGSAGVGAVDAPTFTKGASEIQTLFEGMKGTSQAARRPSGGTISPRSI